MSTKSVSDDYSNTFIETRVSNDRGKCSVTVSGNIDIYDVKQRYKEISYCREDDLVIDCMMTPVPEGYSIIISGHKSLKMHLEQKQSITCMEFFLICRRICELFSICSRTAVFGDFIFDYSAIYIDFGIERAMFVYAPFSMCDLHKMSCCKLIELLYLYTSDEDVLAEQNIKELMKLFCDWEQSGYNDTVFERLSSFVKSYINLVAEKRRSDIFSKGTAAIKRFAEENTKSQTQVADGMNKRSCISFLSGLTKKHKQYIYNGEEACCSEMTIKIGRNKSWASMHVSDMTVSSRHAIVVYKDNNFYLQHIGRIGTTILNGVNIIGNDKVMLLNGSTISFGRSTYKIKITN